MYNTTRVIFGYVKIMISSSGVNRTFMKRAYKQTFDRSYGDSKRRETEQ